MSSYVFIDSRVRNYDLLLASLAPDTQVVILDSTQDGITQIANALEGVAGLDAIHIISHGGEGTLYVGDSILTSDNLSAYTSELETIGAALSNAGDILLYGCEVADGVTGQTFIDNLALYTGADVAASTDVTGSAALNGDWVLEVNTGAIETPAIASATFDGVLAPAIDLTNVAAGTGGFVIYGQDASDLSGRSVASAGDLNGDGFDDLIIGALAGDAAGNAKNYAGDSYVVFGKAGGWAASIDLTTIAAGTGGFVIHGQDVNDYSGTSVASAGDLNGDGFDDLIIGAPSGDAAGNAKNYAGDSYVVFGKASGFGASIDLTAIAAGTGGFVIHGQDASDRSGSSVASAGDLNGDGFDDLIIGARGGAAAGNAKGYAGDSYVVFGKAGGWAASIDLTTIAAGTGGFVIHGQDASDFSGTSVASVGDLNGDGFDDLIIGAPSGDAAGNAKNYAGDSYVVFGKAGGWAASIDLTTIAAGTGGFVIHGQDAGDYSGGSVASAGDLNGDGFDDLIIGAQAGDAAGNAKSAAGDSYVVFGKAGGFGASIDLTTIAAGTGGFVIHGQDADDQSGRSVASAGDLNGDGFDDLIIGARYGDAAGNAKTGAGDSYVVFGKAGGWAASIDLTTIAAGTGGFVIHGQDAGDRSGYSVASAGDLNGDGFDDLIVGADFGDAAVDAKSAAGDSYVIFGKDFNTTVTHQGDANANTLTGDASANIMIGGLGNDTVIGAGGADVMRGGAGDDNFVGGAGADRMNGGNGRDTGDYTNAGVAVTLNLFTNINSGGDASGDRFTDIENLTGSAFGDNLTGDTEANVLSGGGGNDTLSGNAGNDTLNGGTGIDTASYAGAASAVTVTLVSTAAQNTQGAGIDTINTIENLLGSNYQDTLTGNSAANQLDGGAGNDTLDGGSGNDTLKGGSGNDLYIVAQSGDVVIENSGAGTDSVQSSVTHTLAANVEHLTLTGVGNASGNGNTLANSLTGNSGNNTLNGGSGNDTLVGGLGNDTYVVNAAGDVVTEAGAAGNDLVQASTSHTLGTNVENLTLTGAGNSSGNGNSLDNILTGNSKNNALNGGTGDDTMVGGVGNDTYSVNAAGDVVTEVADAGSDTVNTAINYTLTTNVENLTQTGSANTSGTGNSLNNKLTGNSGNNTLNSNDGADTITGGSGADTLTGGTGIDLFDYNALTDAVDTITDFTAGAGGDKLDIDTLMTVLGYGGADPIGAGYVQLLQAGAHTLVKIDSNGGGDNFATTLVTLQNVTAGNVTLADNFIV